MKKLSSPETLHGIPPESARNGRAYIELRATIVAANNSNKEDVKRRGEKFIQRPKKPFEIWELGTSNIHTESTSTAQVPELLPRH